MMPKIGVVREIFLCLFEQKKLPDGYCEFFVNTMIGN